MNNNKPARIVLLGGRNQAKRVDQIRKSLKSEFGEALEAIAIAPVDEKWTIDAETLDAVVMLHAEDAREEEGLFRFIQAIKNLPELKRFIFLPGEYKQRKNHFPPSYHLVRHQQHILFFYNNENEFTQAVQTMTAKARELLADGKEKKAGGITETGLFKRLWRKTLFRTGVFLLPIFIAALIIFIQLLPKTLTALAANPNARGFVTPPEAGPKRFQESFETLNLDSVWDEIHFYQGTQPANCHVEEGHLTFQTDQPVKGNRCEYKSLQSWPLDDLQIIEVSFLLEENPGGSGQGSLMASLVNAENTQLKAGCEIAADETGNGLIRCSLNDLSQQVLLSNEPSFDPAEWHDLMMVFNPARYSFRFFLDGVFFGEIEVPDVKAWRGREFYLTLGSFISNPADLSFIARFDDLTITQQP